jgi:hypothetical protein
MAAIARHATTTIAPTMVIFLFFLSRSDNFSDFIGLLTMTSGTTIGTSAGYSKPHLGQKRVTLDDCFPHFGQVDILLSGLHAWKNL